MTSLAMQFTESQASGADEIDRILESVSEAILVLSPDEVILACNERACAMYGASYDALVGSSLKALSVNVDTGDAHVRTTMAGLGTHHFVTTQRRRDGSVIDLDIQAWRTRYRGCDAIISINRDITEERALAAQLKVREAQLAKAQELARAGSFQWDIETGEIHCSDEMYRLLGYEPKGIIPTIEMVSELLGARNSAAIERAVEAVRQGARDISIQFEIERRDGARRVLDAVTRIERDASGRPMSVIGVAHDVTESHAAARRLETYAKQQAALASLGRLALRQGSAGNVIREAVKTAREVLQADFCAVLTISRTGELIPVASDGWRSDILGQLHPHLTEGTQAAYTLHADAAVRSRDLTAETRFTPEPRMVALGIRSAITAVVGGRLLPYGVIGILHREVRDFTDDEATFLQAVANTLAEAIARDRAETAVATSERIFRQFFDNAPVGIYRTSSDGVLIAANQALAHMLGHESGDELTGLELSSLFVTPEDNPTLAPGKQLSVQTRWRKSDGSIITVAILGNVTVDAAGRLLCDAFVQDITERSAADELLRASETRYRALFHEAFDAVLLADRDDWLLLDFNDAACQVFRCSPREMVAMSRSERFDWSDPRVEEMHRQLEAQSHFRGEIRMRRGDGSTFPAEIAATWYEESAQRRRSVIVVRDISERRAADERLRLQAALLESVTHAVVATDADDLIIHWNRAAEEIFGFMPEEALGRTVGDLRISERSDQRIAMRSVREGTPWRGEVVLRRKSGSRFPAIVAVAPILDASHSIAGHVSIAADISEAKMLEAQLEQAQRIASLGRLAASVAHEFNNVLMGIQPFIDILRRRYKDDEKMEEMTSHMASAVRRGNNIAREILRFSQQGEPVIGQVDLTSFLRDVEAASAGLLPPNVDLAIEILESLTIRADVHQLMQVFSNLLRNAADSMPNGGRVTIIAGRAPDDAEGIFRYLPECEVCAQIVVIDNGAGIDQSVLPHIFEPMYTTKRSGGTGLGLAVVHQIVKRHGGHIFVESAPNAGTSFHLLLPIAESSDAPAGSEAAAPPSLQGAHVRRILLVEDDEQIAEGLSLLLRDGGYEVTHVGEGGAAVEAIERTRPGVVLLDVNLPDVSGEEVYRRIAARWPDLPVIFSTGDVDEARVAKYAENPNVRCLLKPYDIDDLQRMIAEVTAGGVITL
jgi:PAS domain S-box-containing protein